MIVIGLTGGIGSGKSTVSGILKELGAYILDADKIGHEAYRPHTQTWRDVIDAFGEDILQQNNEIDRRKLGRIVFNNPEAMDKLTHIMWPRMYDMVAERIEEQRKLGTKVMVVEAAVLIEANWTPLVDQVWVVVASESAVIRRLKDRNGMSEEQVQARINAQMSSEERQKHADVVIYNDSDLDALKEQVLDQWNSRTVQIGRP